MPSSADTSWELDLASLLDELSAAQRELLALLATKRQLIINRDQPALEALASREQDLASRLRTCHERRLQLLAQAEDAGLPSESLSDLAAALPSSVSSRLNRPLADARQRASLIRHECLSQWVVFQRTVLHLSQLLEIIATGGRSAPTYVKGGASPCGGALLDQAV